MSVYLKSNIVKLAALMDEKCVRGEFCIGGAGCLCPDCQLKQGAKLEAATTLALEVAEVKPADTFGDLEAAAQTAGADAKTIQRSAGTDGAQGVVRVEGAGFQHEGKATEALSISQSQPELHEVAA